MKIILTAIVMLVSVKLVFCCSCTGENTRRQDFENADFVVEGKIVKIERVQLEDIYHVNEAYFQKTDPLMPFTKYTLLVTTIFKGQVKTRKAIIYSSGWNSCGIAFRKGDHYIIYGIHEMFFDGADYIANDTGNDKIIWAYECWSTEITSHEHLEELKILAGM